MKYQVWFHQISGRALEAPGNSANVFQQEADKEKGSVGSASMGAAFVEWLEATSWLPDFKQV